MPDRRQLKVISEICVGLGHISVASIVIPFLFPPFGNQNISSAILGLLIALIFWSVSVLLIKE